MFGLAYAMGASPGGQTAGVGGAAIVTVMFWSVIIGIVVMIVVSKKRKASEIQRIKEEEELRRKQRNYDENQQAIRKRLLELISNANNILLSLPKNISEAEHALKEAENEFIEGAFAPFWDAIERAATCIAHFDFGLQQVLYHSDSYKNEIKLIDSVPPPFNLKFNLLPNAASAANRMRSLVRLAQKDFHYSTIYEQRKTNKLLVAGFTSLGQALSDMSCRVSDSIEALSCSISDMAESNRDNSRELLAGVEALRGHLQSDSETRRDHERMEREMLDNIQRRRKPSIFN